MRSVASEATGEPKTIEAERSDMVNEQLLLFIFQMVGPPPSVLLLMCNVAVLPLMWQEIGFLSATGGFQGPRPRCPRSAGAG